MFRADLIRRWGPFIVATVMTAALAGCVSATSNDLVRPRQLPAPQLKTVTATTLSRLGLSLSAATVPPFCGVAHDVALRGWLRQGTAGCPIDQGTAEAAASGSASRVVESLLARVTAQQNGSIIGKDHLTWLVVVQLLNTNAGALRLGLSELVLVDAYSGNIIGNPLPLRFRAAGRSGFAGGGFGFGGGGAPTSGGRYGAGVPPNFATYPGATTNRTSG